MSRVQAHRLIGASEVSKMLPTGNKPTTESQARPLTKLPAEKQPEAWSKAVESAGGEQPIPASGVDQKGKKREGFGFVVNSFGSIAWPGVPDKVFGMVQEQAAAQGDVLSVNH
ncbi:MAG: hypothetical protein NTV93_05555 [Verrucomicrobia bacterium]|nr:hypothetical protein [Verrucomicrobiota bacterium]